MLRRLRESEDGVTLLELTFAVALFALAVGITARSLISFYASMNVQNERVIAINHCRGMLNAMRSVRDQFPNTTTAPTNFQTNVLAQYPPGTSTNVPAQLRSPIVRIAYESTIVTSNPLVPTVTVEWNDLRGHRCSVALSSALTDR